MSAGPISDYSDGWTEASLNVHELETKSDPEIWDQLVGFAVSWVPPCEVDVDAFFAGADTWLKLLRSGGFKSHIEAVDALERHLDRWYRN